MEVDMAAMGPTTCEGFCMASRLWQITNKLLQMAENIVDELGM